MSENINKIVTGKYNFIKNIKESETFQALKFSFYVIFHPFDGFWMGKREKRANFKAATVILAVLIIVLILSRQYTGFIFNFMEPENFNIFSEVLGIIIPVILWCLSSWGITTLMDGEANMKDIFIATMYALVPIIIINIPMIIISNFITIDESGLYNVLNIISIIWAGFLIFTGTLTIQQYSIQKTILAIGISIIGIAGMIFLFLLFFALVQQLINFLYIFYKELILRF